MKFVPIDKINCRVNSPAPTLSTLRTMAMADDHIVPPNAMKRTPAVVMKNDRTRAITISAHIRAKTTMMTIAANISPAEAAGDQIDICDSTVCAIDTPALKTSPGLSTAVPLAVAPAWRKLLMMSGPHVV